MKTLQGKQKNKRKPSYSKTRILKQKICFELKPKSLDCLKVTAEKNVAVVVDSLGLNTCTVKLGYNELYRTIHICSL